MARYSDTGKVHEKATSAIYFEANGGQLVVNWE